MTKNHFRENHKLFSIQIEFSTHPLFNELDWIFIQKKINSLLSRYKIEVCVLVLLENQIHLVIQSIEAQENYFYEELLKELKVKRPIDINETSICEPINNHRHFFEIYRMIHRLPVELGMSKKVEDYPYSSLQLLLGKKISYCGILDLAGFVQNPFQHLRWLNQSHSQFSPLEISNWKAL